MEALLGRMLQLLAAPVESVWQNLWKIPTYRSGFIAGLIVALVVGWISRQLLYWWNRVLQFFGPTAVPAADIGPSPMDRLREAVFSLVWLIIAVAIIALVLSMARTGTS